MPKKFANCPSCQLPKLGNENKFRTRKYTTMAGETRTTLRTQCKVCEAQDITERRKDPRLKRQELGTHLQSTYGISLEEYESYVDRQGGVCKICKQVPPRQRLVVDHCHSTREFRGLLCHNCNLMLGLAYDNPETLQRASDYLNEIH